MKVRRESDLFLVETGSCIHRLGKKVGSDIQNEYERGRDRMVLGAKLNVAQNCLDDIFKLNPKKQQLSGKATALMSKKI